MTARPRIGLVALAALAAAGALVLAGSGALAPPPLGSWEALDAWYLRVGPAAATLVLVRLVALVASAWLVLMAALQLIAPFVARRGFTAAVDRLSPRFLRALSTTAAGLSVTAGLALPALPSGPADDPPGTAVMVPLDPPVAPGSSSTTTSAPPTTQHATTTSLPPTTQPTTTSPPPSTMPPAGSAVRPAPEPVAAPAGPPPQEVVVAPGDSFWSIAVDEAGERDLVAYWRALIEANRSRLVDPSNPDLLYPDQVLRLP
ncbi:MAG: LysM peptidoglycan-binding domain-containing protein [Acidimicrobiales bacterium]